jgi:hypothetical protein
VVNIGDINHDGIVDIAVHSMQDDDGETDTGAFYILFLNTNGTVQHTQKISALEGNFNGDIGSGSDFSISIVNLGDVDGDGVNDLFAGAPETDLGWGSSRKGHGFILHLNTDGTVKNYEDVSSSLPALTSVIQTGDWFGVSASCFSGFNTSGKKELIIGAIHDNDSVPEAGAVYILDLNVQQKPVANAGKDQTVGEGTIVTLDGSASFDRNQQTITYLWTAPQGINLNDSTVVRPVFTTPDGVIDTTYRFLLVVNDGLCDSGIDTILIAVINETLSISNYSLNYGAIECYNASNNIIIAGGGTSVDFADGSITTIIAGKSIQFLPGFYAHEGCMMSAYITANGTFCDNPDESIIIAQPEKKSFRKKIEPNEKDSVYDGKMIKIYPNPNNGYFKIELTNFETNASISIYNALGAKIYQTLSTNNINHEVILPSTKKGIYFVKVSTGKEQFIKKIIVE